MCCRTDMYRLTLSVHKALCRTLDLCCALGLICRDCTSPVSDERHCNDVTTQASLGQDKTMYFLDTDQYWCAMASKGISFGFNRFL